MVSESDVDQLNKPGLEAVDESELGIDPIIIIAPTGLRKALKLYSELV